MSNIIEDVGHPRVNGYPCVCRECVGKRAFLQRGGSVESLCSRDHCTSEERTVIEAAVAYYEAGQALHAYFEGDGLGNVYPLVQASEDAGERFKTAITELLAARAGKEHNA